MKIEIELKTEDCGLKTVESKQLAAAVGSQKLLCDLCAFFVSFVVKTTWKFGVRYWILEIEIISAFPCGVYVVEVRTEEVVGVRKFIKE